MSLFKFKTCIEACETLDVSCPNQECRSWISYEEDLNCTNISVKKHGQLTLREISKRLGCSFVRVKQLEEEILSKLNNEMKNKNYL